MSCGGVNQFLSVPVPVVNEDGPILDVSGLVAEKTIYLAGQFSGQYVILGSHDDVKFVPILKFDGGQGPQPVRRDIMMTLKSIRVRRGANQNVAINIASQATCNC